jgi:FKBP-type peptidyl-prolyl cis-trans isomerase FkpA
MINREGEIFKGYFPKNYIKEKPRVRNAPKPPPRPISLPKHEGSGSSKQSGDALTKVTTDMGDMRVMEHPGSSASSIRVNRGPSFSLKSLPAFDDLMSKGYAIEVKEKEKNSSSSTSPAGRGASAAAGSLVEMSVHAMIWDGASTFTKTFANSKVKFIVGKHSQIPAGLQAAAQSLGVGQSATVTCAPSLAFGAAGNPPYVPPNSFVVFEITIQNVSSPSDPSMEVECPIELISSVAPVEPRAVGGVSSSSGAKSNRKKNNTEDTRIVLVPPDVNKDNHAYEMGDERTAVKR